MRARAGHGFEIRQGIERQIHFAGRAAEFVAINVFEKILRQVSCFDETS